MNPTPPSARQPRHSRARRAQQRAWRQLAITVPPGKPGLLAPVRRLIVANLLAWGAAPDRARDVELCASELLTNALLHTPGPARLHLAVHGRAAHLKVSDTSTHPPTTLEPDQDGHRESGRGLHIVETLADTIHTQIHPGRGKTITAIFHLA